MGKLNEVFGKETGIKLSDIQNRIVESTLEESVTVEYKSPAKASKVDDELIEKALIRPLVAFLNTTARQSSLLILGIVAKNGTPEEIEPIPEQLVTSEQIRSWITARIGSVPPVRKFPDIRIITVRAGSRGSVFVLELGEWERAGYYSKSTNLSYIRRTDESDILPLPDFLSLVKALSASRSALRISKVKVETVPPTGGLAKDIGPRKERTRYSIQVSCVNDGTKPASHVSGFIAIDLEDHTGVDARVEWAGANDVSAINPGVFKVYSFKASDDDTPILYPHGHLVLGDVIVEADAPLDFVIGATTNDLDGTVKQAFEVSSDGSVTDPEERYRLWSW